MKERDGEKLTSREGASHLQERVRRESATHTVKSMMIGYSHARERRYSIDINIHTRDGSECN